MIRNPTRVVVTGLGTITPLGCQISEFWSNLLAGVSGVQALEEPEFTGLRTRIGARVRGFDPDAYFGRKEARRMSRTSQLAVYAADQAITDACLTKSEVDRSLVGVMIGSSIGGFSASDPFYRDFYLHQKQSPLVIPVSMNNGPSSQVSIKYGFQGLLVNIDAACASAAHAIGYAYNLVRSGLLKVVIAGGADSPFSPGVMAAWCSLRALSERNETPAEACRPFSADRDGLVLGEGAGVLVLESLESAVERGARILAEVTGYGASSDGFHLTQPSPEGPALAMRRALMDAGLRPEQIDAINAHGTGTPWNDRIETAAIKEALAHPATKIPVISTKAALGHAIGASGALELIASILSIRSQMLPPTLNYRKPDPDCDLDYVTEGCRPHRIRYMMSNSFAFGGSNASLIVGPCGSSTGPGENAASPWRGANSAQGKDQSQPTKRSTGPRTATAAA